MDIKEQDENEQDDNVEDVENTEEAGEDRFGKFRIKEEDIQTKNLSKDELSAAERRRIEKKVYIEKQAEVDELKVKLQEFTDEQEAKRLEELSELEKAQEDIETLNSQLNSINTEKAELENSYIQEKWINENAPQELPGIYKSLITGTTEEELKTALESTIKKFETDFKQTNGQKSVGVVPPSKEEQQDIDGEKNFGDMDTKELREYLATKGYTPHSF